MPLRTLLSDASLTLSRKLAKVADDLHAQDPQAPSAPPPAARRVEEKPVPDIGPRNAPNSFKTLSRREQGEVLEGVRYVARMGARNARYFQEIQFSAPVGEGGKWQQISPTWAFNRICEEKPVYIKKLDSEYLGIKGNKHRYDVTERPGTPVRDFGEFLAWYHIEGLDMLGDAGYGDFRTNNSSSELWREVSAEIAAMRKDVYATESCTVG